MQKRQSRFGNRLDLWVQKILINEARAWVNLRLESETYGCSCPDERGSWQVATFVFKLERKARQMQKPKTSLANLLGSQTGSSPFNEKHNFRLSHLGWKGLLVSHLNSNTLTLTLPCTTELFSNPDSGLGSLASAQACCYFLCWKRNFHHSVYSVCSLIAP